MMADLPVCSLPFRLQREGYEAAGSLAWVPTGRFGEFAMGAADFLHPQEVEAYASLKVPRRQASYLLGRLTAKAAPAALSGPALEPAAVPIVAGIFNQPVVRSRELASVSVSISHSDRLVCSIAFPEEHPMAVDVEEVDAKRTEAMMTQIGPQEAGLASSICKDGDEAATVLWTAKEALSKALRCGMTCPYQLMEVCDLKIVDSHYEGRFRHFGQYRFQAWRRGSSVLCIVLPLRTRLGLAVPDLLA